MTTNDPGLGSQSRRTFANWFCIFLVFGVLSMFVGRGCLPISIGEKLPFGFGAKYRDMCRECGGDGKVEHNCSACRGVGYFQGVKCEACGATGKVEDACAFCGGSGKKPKD